MDLIAGSTGEESGDGAAGSNLPRLEAQCVPLLCQRSHHRIVFGCGFYRHVPYSRTAGEIALTSFKLNQHSSRDK